MIILDATLSAVRRNRDFGRVEASVTFLVKRAGQPVRPQTIRTSVPIRGADSLRRRLVRDAGILLRALRPAREPLPRVA